jgi:hypothetical protein
VRFGLVRALAATLFLHPAVSNQSFVDAAFLDRKRVMFGLSRGKRCINKAYIVRRADVK